MRPLLALLLFLLPATAPAQKAVLLRPERAFDGVTPRPHAGWVVLVRGERIAAVGPSSRVAAPPDAEVVELPGTTLLPGLIEGAGDADVGLKQAIEQGIIPGPRMPVATRALVATGSYAPRGLAPEWAVPQGAEEADGMDGLVRAVRGQIGRGADRVKLDGDYRWSPGGEARPTLLPEELTLAVDAARSSGRPVAVHASAAEGIRRAVLAGAETIEHGDGGTPEVWRLMARRGVYLCPTVAATEAIQRYRGGRPGTPEPEALRTRKAAVRAALAARAPLCLGGDSGVFAHGDSARELELLVELGMSPADVLRAATSVNARMLHLEDRPGQVKAGPWANLVAVEGDPPQDIRAVRRVRLVMKGGTVSRHEAGASPARRWGRSRGSGGRARS